MAHVFREISLAVLFAGVPCLGCAALAQPNDAEPATRRANAEVLRSLPFGDRADFDDAQRGFIAPVPGAVATKPGSATRPLPGIAAEVVTRG